MDVGIVTNSARAGWAQEAIDAFRAVCPTDEEDALGDLIVDLLHAYRLSGHTVEEAQSFLDAKFAMFEAETLEDPDD